MGKGKRRGRNARRLVLATAFVTGAIFGARARADSFSYSSSGNVGTYTVTDWASLSGAVADANSNLIDKIIINLAKSTTYSLLNGLTIDRHNVTITGVSGAILDGSHLGSGVTSTVGITLAVGASGSKISGLQIQDFVGSGVSVAGSNCTISGTTLTNNTGFGVLVTGANATIQGNTIENQQYLDGGNDYAQGGVYVGNSVSGTRIAENTISNNAGFGVIDRGTDTVVQGNAIGRAPLGAEGNGRSGIWIDGATGTKIGVDPSTSVASIAGFAPNSVALDASVGNVISGNYDHGILITNSSSVTIRGNYIGTDQSGFHPLGNTNDGINVQNSTNTAITRNVISGNDNNGISITSSDRGTISGNIIGPNAGGQRPLAVALNGFPSGNGTDGILIASGSGHVVGLPGDGNIIAYNGSVGVAIQTATDANAIRGNSIFTNTFGISNSDTRPTPNSPDDSAGPQNYPVLQSAILNGTLLTVTGSLPTIPGADSFILDFYANSGTDLSNLAEGEIYLGNWADLGAYDASTGQYNFTAVLGDVHLPTLTSANWTITATATRSFIDSAQQSESRTSEFSAPFDMSVVPSTAVPLPSAALMVSVALAGLGGVRFIRRRRRTR